MFVELVTLYQQVHLYRFEAGCVSQWHNSKSGVEDTK